MMTNWLAVPDRLVNKNFNKYVLAKNCSYLVNI